MDGCVVLWSSGLLHLLMFRDRRFETRFIKDVGSSRMCDGVPKLICLDEATNRIAMHNMKRRRRQVFHAQHLT